MIYVKLAGALLKVLLQLFFVSMAVVAGFSNEWDKGAYYLLFAVLTSLDAVHTRLEDK